MFGFSSVEHVLSSVAHDFVKVGKAVAKLTPLLNKVAASEAAVEAATKVVVGALNPAAEPLAIEIERAAYAALGLLTKAANDYTTGTANAPLSVGVTVEIINDFKALYKFLAGKAAVDGVTL